MFHHVNDINVATFDFASEEWIFLNRMNDPSVFNKKMFSKFAIFVILIIIIFVSMHMLQKTDDAYQQ